MQNVGNLIKSIFVVVLCSSCSCTDSQNQQGSRSRSSSITLERYIEVNRQMVEGEQRLIAEYLEEQGVEMQRTETGMWYNIEKPGLGATIKAGKLVTLAYKVWLLDGTLCYSSDSLGNKVFVVGHGGVESGLEDAVLMLKKGSVASFIMPPHLAHGLIGDDDKIPARAILKYDVEVLDVTHKK